MKVKKINYLKEKEEIKRDKLKHQPAMVGYQNGRMKYVTNHII